MKKRREREKNVNLGMHIRQRRAEAAEDEKEEKKLCIGLKGARKETRYLYVIRMYDVFIKTRVDVHIKLLVK